MDMIYFLAQESASSCFLPKGYYCENIAATFPQSGKLNKVQCPVGALKRGKEKLTITQSAAYVNWFTPGALPRCNMGCLRANERILRKFL